MAFAFEVPGTQTSTGKFHPSPACTSIRPARIRNQPPLPSARGTHWNFIGATPESSVASTSKGAARSAAGGSSTDLTVPYSSTPNTWATSAWSYGAATCTGVDKPPPESVIAVIVALVGAGAVVATGDACAKAGAA